MTGHPDRDAAKSAAFDAARRARLRDLSIAVAAALDKALQTPGDAAARYDALEEMYRTLNTEARQLMVGLAFWCLAVRRSANGKGKAS
jgi:hypothetical protein